jgi:hypothetical protein
MKTMLILASVIAAAGFCLIAFAGDDGEKPGLALDKLDPMEQSFEQDCPACGWSLKTSGSNDKPAEGFEGVFEPGTQCPFCKGAGKLFDRIDWKKGTIIAIGVATAETKTPADGDNAAFAQEKLMAQRGAKAVALRNAAAYVMQVRLYGGKPMPKSFERKLTAFVNNFELFKMTTADAGKKPAAMAVVVVPLWGVKSVSGEVYDSERKRFLKAVGQAPADEDKAVAEESFDEETVIVVDMRGGEFPPHLFPQVVDDNGGRVYDMTFVSRKNVVEQGMAEYVYMKKDEKSFEELKSGLESGSLIIRQNSGMLASIEPACPLVYAEDADSPAAPDNSGGVKKAGGAEQKQSGKKKKIIVVRGTAKNSADSKKAVVSKEDAQKMEAAEKSGGAKTRGKVVFINDSRGPK